MKNNRCVRELAGSMRRMPWIAMVVLLAAQPSTAQQTIDCLQAGLSCNYSISDLAIKNAPEYIKFQARISQAKLPVGEVVFPKVYVNLMQGTKNLGKEEFSQVKVRDSVLNLEIGRTMVGGLPTFLAQNEGLSFQICLGNEENCLKPVSLSSVPYAIKSTYAKQAEVANLSDTAIQCHYAHRVTADRDMFRSQAIGKGYFDFYTPSPDLLEALIDDVENTGQSVPAEHLNGGYIQWAQVDGASSNLHICAQDINGGNSPKKLDELYLHAAVSRNLGMLIVDGPRTAVGLGEIDIDDPFYGPYHPLNRQKGLFVKRGGMDVHGETHLFDDVIIQELPSGLESPPPPQPVARSGAPRVTIGESHEFHDEGPAYFHRGVTVGDDSGDIAIVNSRLYANAKATFNEETEFKNDTVVGDAVNASTMTVNSTTVFEGTIGTPSTIAQLDIYQDTVFHGNVTLPSNANFVCPGCIDAEDINLADDFVFTGNVTFNGGVTSPGLRVPSYLKSYLLDTTEDIAIPMPPAGEMHYGISPDFIETEEFSIPNDSLGRIFINITLTLIQDGDSERSSEIQLRIKSGSHEFPIKIPDSLRMDNGSHTFKVFHVLDMTGGPYKLTFDCRARMSSIPGDYDSSPITIDMYSSPETQTRADILIVPVPED